MAYYLLLPAIAFVGMSGFLIKRSKEVIFFTSALVNTVVFLIISIYLAFQIHDEDLLTRLAWVTGVTLNMSNFDDLYTHGFQGIFEFLPTLGRTISTFLVLIPSILLFAKRKKFTSEVSSF